MANENWNYAVGGVVLKGNEVLLVRHTYGNAKGKLLIPGGYCNIDELPQEAARREIMEETGVIASVGDLLAIRFNTKTWYAVFLMEFISGEPASDGNENSEALFMSIDEALKNPQVTDMTKKALRMVKENRSGGLKYIEDYSAKKGKDYALFGII